MWLIYTKKRLNFYKSRRFQIVKKNVSIYSYLFFKKWFNKNEVELS